jgi:hypothetical protein
MSRKKTRVDSLSHYETIVGTLLFFGPVRFSERAFIRFFRDLETSRMNVRSISTAASFMDMYYVLEPLGSHLTDQNYRIRPAMIGAVRRDLESCGVLPEHEAFLRGLADRFRTSIRTPLSA